MTVKRRRQSMAGSILEQFAELKSDYEIGKASRYKRAKTGIMTLGSHADYHYRTEAAYFGAMETAREMTRNNPLVMQGVRRLVADVVSRGFVHVIRAGAFKGAGTPGTDIPDETLARTGLTDPSTLRCVANRIRGVRGSPSRRAVKMMTIAIWLACDLRLRGRFRPTHVPNKRVDEVTHAAKPPITVCGGQSQNGTPSSGQLVAPRNPTVD